MRPSGLEETVRELRHLAHGVRPARLDDGLGPALEAVRAASPVPVGLVIGDLPAADETRTVTADLVVSEAVANALKHAASTSRSARRGTASRWRCATTVSEVRPWTDRHPCVTGWNPWAASSRSTASRVGARPCGR